MQMQNNTERLQPFTAAETAAYYAHGTIPERFKDMEEQRRKEIIGRYAPRSVGAQSNLSIYLGGMKL